MQALDVQAKPLQYAHHGWARADCCTSASEAEDARGAEASRLRASKVPAGCDSETDTEQESRSAFAAKALVKKKHTETLERISEKNEEMAARFIQQAENQSAGTDDATLSAGAKA